MATAAQNTSRTAFAVLVEDPELRHELEPCIRRAAGRVVVDTCGIQTGADGPCGIGTSQPDIAVVEQPRDGRDLAAIIDAIRAEAPEAQVLVVGRNADADTILAAIRAGARDFIPSPLEHSFADAVNRVIAEKTKSHTAAGHAGGQVFGFVSAKGGCGATTLALSTAIALSRETAAPTLLADLDLATGLLRFLINNSNPNSVLDAALHPDKLDESYWGALVSSYCGIDVVGVHPRDYTRPETQDAHFSRVLRFMRSRYAWSFLDLGRGITSCSAEMLDDIDSLYIVATTDPLALVRAKHLADFLRRRCDYHSLHLVLNGIEKLRSNAVAHAECLTQMEVCCTIPNADQELREALLANRPLAANTLLSRSCRTLARKIAGLASSAAPDAAKGLAFGVRRIFAKIGRPAPAEAPSENAGEAQWELNTHEATTAARAGKFGQACKHLTAALEAASAFGQDDPRIGRTLVQLGVVQCNQEQHAEAERSLKRGAGILERALGKAHPLTVEALSRLAAVFRASGKLAVARQLYDTLLPEAEAALGSKHPVIADLLDGFGDVHLAAGDTPAALFALRRSLAIKEENLGPSDWDVALTLEKLSEFYLKQGRCNEAEPLLWRVVSIRTAILGEGSPGLADSYQRLGSLYASQRKFSDAERLMRYSMALLSTGELAPDVPARLRRLAEVAEGLAKLSEAAAIRQLATSILSVVPDARTALEHEFRPSLSAVPRPALRPAWAQAEA